MMLLPRDRVLQRLELQMAVRTLRATTIPDPLAARVVLKFRIRKRIRFGRRGGEAA